MVNEYTIHCFEFDAKGDFLRPCGLMMSAENRRGGLISWPLMWQSILMMLVLGTRVEYLGLLDIQDPYENCVACLVLSILERCSRRNIIS